LLSQHEYHKKNLTFVIETLLNNNYPIDFIFNTINERLKSLLSNKTLKQKRMILPMKILLRNHGLRFIYFEDLIQIQGHN